ncbi:MAG: ATP cone domain-containing protein, partial [Candidatus Aenigmatarchaeota archaeon]
MDLARIRKRNGRIVPFNKNKLLTAISKAFMSVGRDEPQNIQAVAEDVLAELKKRYNGNVMGVEDVQDVVEQSLIKHNFADVAKSYILYRQKHKELREMKSLMGETTDDLKLPVNSYKVLKARYLQKDAEGKVIETPRQLFTRVAKAIAEPDRNYGASDEDVKATARRFFKMMTNLEFMPNSPTLFNAGTGKSLALSACFVIPVGDSIEDIFDAVKYMAMVQKAGGGTGFSFSRLRPKGSPVKSTSGVASGPLSFMRVFNVATDVIKQGGKRRGANMGVMRVDHPDIIDFISCKEKDTEMTNFNLSVGITDAFMEAALKGENYDLIDPKSKKPVGHLNARKVFSLLSTFAWKNGDPGIVFLDEINRHNPTPAVGEIEATNPCVTRDTFISTGKGLMRMDALVKEYPDGGLKIAADARVTINISCGCGAGFLMQAGEKGVVLNEISKSVFSGVKEVYRLVTESGYELEATGDHKVLTTEGWVELKDSLGCRVLIQGGEGGFGEDYALPFEVRNRFLGANRREYRLNLPERWNIELGQALGWLVSDGWLRDGDKDYQVGFTFSRQDAEALRHLKQILDRWYGREIKEVWRENNVCHLTYHSKYFVRFFRSLGVKCVKAVDKVVPEAIFGAPKEAVIGFLQGLFSADGTIGAQESKQNYYVRLTSKSEKLLKGVQLLLLNLGIKSKIYDRSRRQRVGFGYTTTSGEPREYALDGLCFELNISRENIPRFLEQAGFLCAKHMEKVRELKGRRYYS